MTCAGEPGRAGRRALDVWPAAVAVAVAVGRVVRGPAGH